MEQKDDKSVGRESDKFMLRLPDGMRERIAELAKQNGRSMNAEIVARLDAALSGSSSENRLTSTVVTMGRALDTLNRLTETQDALLMSIGVYLRLAVERVPRGDDKRANEIMDAMASVGSALAHGDLGSAMTPLEKLSNLGMKWEDLDSTGQVLRELGSKPKTPETEHAMKSAQDAIKRLSKKRPAN
jgi:hypothetical protein